jgi:hypothetical protein
LEVFFAFLAGALFFAAMDTSPPSSEKWLDDEGMMITDFLNDAGL